MKRFHKEVDKRSRKEMEGFLAGHFRYNTINSWNRRTSYANNMKIHRLGLTGEQTDSLYELMDCEGAYDRIDDMIWEFGYAHKWQWQAGFNGRNGGYLVLYRGGWRPSAYKSYCTACGQGNYKTVEESGCRCGRCGRETRRNFDAPQKEVFKLSGQGVDMDGDYGAWSIEELRERVQLVEEFDMLCDKIAEEAAWMTDNLQAEEQEVYVPATKMVLKERSV